MAIASTGCCAWLYVNGVEGAFGLTVAFEALQAGRR